MGVSQEKIGSLHVVGGGCFGVQCSRHLLRAHLLALVDYDQLIVVDQSQKNRVSTEIFDPKLRLINQDWVVYLSDLLVDEYQKATPSLDHWVPAHFSPHILFLAFQRAVEKILQGTKFEVLSFQDDIHTPIQKALRSKDVALSFAKWRCLINCPEPSICPMTSSERDWDMRETLEHFFSTCASTTSIHLLQCLHLVHGVASISLAKIVYEFRVMLDNIQSDRVSQIAVATISKCHGLLGVARLIKVDG